MNLDFIPNPEDPVLVIGAAGFDIVGSLKTELTPGTSNASNIRTSFGGVARNVAENLAHLGQPVVLLTAVGSDQAGESLLQGMSACGVDTSAILRTEDFPTGSYLAVLTPHAELKFALDDMRIVSQISSAYLKEHEQLFREASLIFLDANLSRETLRTAMSLARKARVPVCADPVSEGLAARLVPHLPRISLVTPNCAEVSVLSGLEITSAHRRQQALAAAKALVSQGVEIAIVSMAQYGVCYASSETSGHVPAIRTDVVDPTGVGDAMTATVIFALLNHMPLDDAVRLGVSAAALTMGHRGTVVSDLTLEKLYDKLVI